jgi:hypothetical protein
MKNIQKILCVLLCSSFVGGVARGVDIDPILYLERAYKTGKLLDAVNDEDSEQIKKLLEDTPPEERVELVGGTITTDNYVVGMKTDIRLIDYACERHPDMVKYLIDQIPQEARFDLLNKDNFCSNLLCGMSGLATIYTKYFKDNTDAIQYLIESIPEREDRYSFIVKQFIDRKVLTWICNPVKMKTCVIEFIKYILSYAKDDSEKILWIQNNSLVGKALRATSTNLLRSLLEQIPEERRSEIFSKNRDEYETYYYDMRKILVYYGKKKRSKRYRSIINQHHPIMVMLDPYFLRPNKNNRF